MVNEPPLLPATVVGVPATTAVPPIVVTVSGSPSTSVSLDNTLPPAAPVPVVSFSSTVRLSGLATGGGLPTVQVKVCVTVPPWPSSAVTVTE